MRYTMGMPEDAQTLPDDPSRLKDMVAEGLRECGVLMGELKSRDILIEKLKHQLAGMRQHRFGSRSEALDQLALTLEDEEIHPGFPRWIAILMTCLVDSAIRINAIPSSQRASCAFR